MRIHVISHTTLLVNPNRNKHAPVELDGHGRTWTDGMENWTRERKTIGLSATKEGFVVRGIRKDVSGAGLSVTAPLAVAGRASSMASDSTTSVNPYWTSAGSTQLVPIPGASLPAPQSSISSMADITPVPKDEMLLDEFRPLSHRHSLNPSLTEPWDINAFNSPPRLRGALARVASASTDFQIPRPSGGGVEQGSWYDFRNNSPQEQPSTPPSMVSTPTEHESVPTDPATPSIALTATIPAAPTMTAVGPLPTSHPEAPVPAITPTPATASTAPHLDDLLKDIVNPEVHRSRRAHIPSTRQEEANNIGSDIGKRSHKPRK
ncbi:hypothetical protein C8R48DRAFT_680058 [Suillus tomentosus]|nr:hypothetical protein C8R48DRAFT_680058 [Suillus tomentosus]